MNQSNAKSYEMQIRGKNLGEYRVLNRLNTDGIRKCR